LQAYGLLVRTGEEYQPNQVSDKIRGLIDLSDLFFAIVLPQEDRSWITGELHYAFHKGKEPFVLEESGSGYKAALLGDWENIRFNAGHISESFTKILEGFRRIRGEG
jgi:hypothetical protein